MASAERQPSPILPRHDRCPACDSTLALDQRYCVECGERCGAARAPFIGAMTQGVQPPASPQSRPGRPRSQPGQQHADRRHRHAAARHGGWGADRALGARCCSQERQPGRPDRDDPRWRWRAGAKRRTPDPAERCSHGEVRWRLGWCRRHETRKRGGEKGCSTRKNRDGWHPWQGTRVSERPLHGKLLRRMSSEAR